MFWRRICKTITTLQVYLSFGKFGSIAVVCRSSLQFAFSLKIYNYLRPIFGAYLSVSIPMLNPYLIIIALYIFYSIMVKPSYCHF